MRCSFLLATSWLAACAIPRGARTIDATGRTVMPGLVDLHVHLLGGWNGLTVDMLGFARGLDALLYAGITTTLDLGSSQPFVQQLHQEIAADRLRGPRLLFVGPIFDGPAPVWPPISFTISSADQLPRYVRPVRDMGASVVKAYGGPDTGLLAQLVAAAAADSMRVFADVWQRNGSLEDARTGIAAFAHVAATPMTDEAVAFMADHGVASITTLAVMETRTRRRCVRCPSLVGLALAAILASPARPAGLAAQSGHTVTGIVRDTADTPVAGAEVLIGPRRGETDPTGRFRIGGVDGGSQLVTVRAIGFHPSRSRIDVPVPPGGEVEVWLMPAPVHLPVIVVEGRRTGVYGVVGDTAYRPALGARAELLGVRGGSQLTDSLGRFAFPEAGGGTYLLRVTLPGYTERRRILALNRGEGREVTVLLAPAPPGTRPTSGAAAAALWDLDRRLAWTTQRDRFTRDELDRFGSLPLCEIPVVRRLAGSELILLVDGHEVYFGDAACSWRADEVDLLEWGDDGCREPSGTLRSYVPGGCDRIRSPLGARVQGRGYVSVWRRW